MSIYQNGVRYGNRECSAALYLLFDEGHWSSSNDEEKAALRELGVTIDPARASRYRAISDALQINPDLKLTRLDTALPLPPAQLPTWSGVEDVIDQSRQAHLLIELETPMSLQIITVGDLIDHGGKVISGSPTHDIGGKAIARLGDEVFCPQCYPGGKPHGVNKIITAHETLTAGGIPVAVKGCKTECGCTLIGKANATVG